MADYLMPKEYVKRGVRFLSWKGGLAGEWIAPDGTIHRNGINTSRLTSPEDTIFSWLKGRGFNG